MSFIRPVAIISLVVLAAGCERRAEQEPQASDTPDAVSESAESTGVAPVLPADRPRLRAGLWRVSTSDGERLSTTLMCVDAASQDRMGALAAQMVPSACSQHEMRDMGGGAWSSRMVCDLGSAGRMSSESVAQGDFERRYTVETRYSTTGAAMESMNRSGTTAAESVYQGPCPEGMRAGEIELEGGLRFNMLEVEGRPRG